MARAGWVARTNRTATVGLRHSEPFALRAPSCERAGPRRARVGSGPAPLSPAGGHPLAARPTRGARRQWPAQPTWPCKGRRPGPPATLLAFPGLHGAPVARGPAQRLLPLRCSTLLPPLSSPSVVVPAGTPALVPTAAAAPPAPPGAEFCRRVAVTVLPLDSALFFSREKKKVAVNVF